MLEIKYVLNWWRSCQARIQFLRFIVEGLHERFCVNKPENGLIIFHHFSSDWTKKGWDNFYKEENVLSKNMMKTDIAQLVDGCFIPYPVVTDW